MAKIYNIKDFQRAKKEETRYEQLYVDGVPATRIKEAAPEIAESYSLKPFTGLFEDFVRLKQSMLNELYSQRDKLRKKRKSLIKNIGMLEKLPGYTGLTLGLLTFEQLGYHSGLFSRGLDKSPTEATSYVGLSLATGFAAYLLTKLKIPSEIRGRRIDLERVILEEDINRINTEIIE